ncbi:MAG: YgjV family protein [Ruminococcaceae bacterium]|nr:YgjV family protein [Oscillospiraceae bacterium]
MEKIAFVIGIIAVILYLSCYQQKKRSRIILFNATSRVLYIIQYILLGAFEGATLDILGTISSVLAQKKNTPFIKKNMKWFIVGLNLLIIGAGLPLYKNIFSLFPLIGVILHTDAFWMDDEKRIRQISLAGSPFWLIYNFVNQAYGSCVGDVLSIISLVTAMFRYDFKKKR